jgi:hypothetical protein
MVIKVGQGEDEVLAAVEYPCTEEMDVLNRAIVPTCRALSEQLEGE